MKCQQCGEDVDDLESVTVLGKRRRLCEDCAERARESEAISDEAQGTVRKMMEYKGR